MTTDPALQEKLDALDAFYRGHEEQIKALQDQGFCSLVFNKAVEIVFQSQEPGRMFLSDDDLAELTRRHGGQVFPFSFGGPID